MILPYGFGAFGEALEGLYYGIMTTVDNLSYFIDGVEQHPHACAAAVAVLDDGLATVGCGDFGDHR